MKKAPYLQAVLLAMAVHRYDTKRIAWWRGSRATTEATGCCHRAPIVYTTLKKLYPSCDLSFHFWLLG
jgi:hypothetical protein